MAFFIAYISGVILFPIIDFFGIYYLVLPAFRRSPIGEMLRDRPDLVASGLFYLMYIGAIFFFVIEPAIKNSSSLMEVMFRGGIFGAACYLTYELTSLAVMKGWTWNMLIIDSLWGAIATAIVTGITFSIYKYFI